MPHPVYGTSHWICVLNPTDSTFKRLKPLPADAHELAVTGNQRPVLQLKTAIIADVSHL